MTHVEMTPRSAIERSVIPDELARFAELQAVLARSFPALVEDPLAPRTVLVIPSLSLDQEIMARISGVYFRWRGWMRAPLRCAPHQHSAAWLTPATSTPQDAA